MPLADALAKAAQRDEGLAAIDEAIEGRRKAEVPTGTRSCQRLRGELLLANNRSDNIAAESCLLQAIEIAHTQSAKSLELRSATSLRDCRAIRAGAPRLMTCYGWFTEGFDTANLKAKALLNEGIARPKLSLGTDLPPSCSGGHAVPVAPLRAGWRHEGAV
jgi:hypothetical protein